VDAPPKKVFRYFEKKKGSCYSYTYKIYLFIGLSACCHNRVGGALKVNDVFKKVLLNLHFLFEYSALGVLT